MANDFKVERIFNFPQGPLKKAPLLIPSIKHLMTEAFLNVVASTPPPPHVLPLLPVFYQIHESERIIDSLLLDCIYRGRSNCKVY